MKFITKTSAAVIVAALGLGALAPAALAHDWGRQQQAGPGGAGPRHEMAFRGDQDGPRFGGQRQMGDRGGMRGGLLQLGCSEQGAQRLEHVFVSLSYNLELTAEQQPLFDALKTAALTAQTGLADTCAAAQPAAADATQAPNIVERMQTRIKVDEARTTAMSEVLPELQAFYDSLTDAQKAKLDAGPGKMRGQHGKRQGGPGMMQQFGQGPMRSN